MTVTNSSCASQLYNVCIEPFHQGLCNLQTAFSCKKVTLVATDILKSSAPVTKPISFARRVASLALGTLLFIPVINSIVMAILQCAKSSYLYPPVKQPSSDPVQSDTGSKATSEVADSKADVDLDDGSDSDDYCSFCFKDGSFLLPDLTLEQMMEMSIDHMTTQLNFSKEEAKRLTHDIIPHCCQCWLNIGQLNDNAGRS